MDSQRSWVTQLWVAGTHMRKQRERVAGRKSQASTHALGTDSGKMAGRSGKDGGGGTN